MKLRVKLTCQTAVVPRQYDGDAGLDLHAAYEYIVQPGKPTRVQTGVAVEIPDGYVGFILPRSGCSLEGRTVVTGTIDPGYRGEISAVAYTLGPWWTIKAGDRVAQLVIVPCPRWEVELASELSETSRGVRGFGSTGLSGPRREAGNGG